MISFARSKGVYAGLNLEGARDITTTPARETDASDSKRPSVSKTPAQAPSLVL